MKPTLVFIFLFVVPLFLNAQVENKPTEAFEICRSVYQDVKKELPDVSKITAENLLETTKKVCDHCSSKPEEVSMCKEIATALNKNVFEFIKKEGSIGPQKICAEIVVCKPK